ncbi:MAG TPA: tRNA pseudouridine(38-40) synthase TruA [Bacteroidota bacterium]|nr:tRNA pseudouridine(38-40) synthase TruA [Bacteroidota bacterium]
MRNIKLTLEYDGTDFVGWQVQPNGRSVQEELEKALRQILQEECKTNAAGRTDSGVHARGQVANFVTSSAVALQPLVKSLNGVLPEDVVVLNAEEVDEQFHARYSAKSRRYRYVISRTPTALLRKYSWPLGYQLDVALMQRCADTIRGEHDFQSFCKAEAEVNHYRCIVHSAEWRETGSMLEFNITANRFLHGMVRALVGTMVDVGRGYTSFEEFNRILEARKRNVAGMAAPSKGLFLEEVMY